MDDERLKQGEVTYGKNYFRELLGMRLAVL